MTPLTARMVAAWLVAFGLAAALSLLVRDLARLRIATIGYTVFGALELAALLGYGQVVRWESPAATIYLIGLLAVVATGAAGWRLAVRPDTAANPGAHP